MLVYVPVSWCYRMAMLAAVALFVASHFFLVGVGMAALTVLLGIGLPLAKGLSRVVSSPFYAGRRLRSVGLTYGAVAVVALALLFLRVPVHTTAQGVVWLPESSLVRAGTDGFITEVEATPGEAVQRGATLFTLRHDLFEARMKVRAARVDELQAKLKADFVNDRIAAGVDSFELGQEQAALAREQERLLRMVVLAGQDGVFTPSRPVGDAPGRYVKEGDVLGWVTPSGGAVARVLVPQEDMGLMQDRLRDVRLLLPDGETALPTHVLRAVPGGALDLPNPAFASTNGGSIPVDVRETKVLRAFERYFQFDLALPSGIVPGAADESCALRRPGSRAVRLCLGTGGRRAVSPGQAGVVEPLRDLSVTSLPSGIAHNAIRILVGHDLPTALLRVAAGGGGLGVDAEQAKGEPPGQQAERRPDGPVGEPAEQGVIEGDDVLGGARIALPPGASIQLPIDPLAVAVLGEDHMQPPLAATPCPSSISVPRPAMLVATVMRPA